MLRYRESKEKLILGIKPATIVMMLYHYTSRAWWSTSMVEYRSMEIRKSQVQFSAVDKYGFSLYLPGMVQNSLSIYN